jgi:putative ABC transport system substrate-binding protein
VIAVGLVIALALGILAAPPASDAQPPAKVPRIGYLVGRSSTNVDLASAFQQGLRDLGYVEGKNVVIEYRYAEGKPERLPDLAADLVRRKVDVIVAAGEAAIRAAQHATSTIPIVSW